MPAKIEACCAVVCRECMRHRQQHLRAETRSVHEEAVVAGATHLSVNTMGAGLKTVDDHLAALAIAAEAAKTISG